nr:hypothetical protein [uncultured bacterium]
MTNRESFESLLLDLRLLPLDYYISYTKLSLIRLRISRNDRGKMMQW